MGLIKSFFRVIVDERLHFSRWLVKLLSCLNLASGVSRLEDWLMDLSCSWIITLFTHCKPFTSCFVYIVLYICFIVMFLRQHSFKNENKTWIALKYKSDQSIRILYKLFTMRIKMLELTIKYPKLIRLNFEKKLQSLYFSKFMIVIHILLNITIWFLIHSKQPFKRSFNKTYE